MKKVLLFFLAVFVLSCEQKEGERCQQKIDCGPGLMCCWGVGGMPGSNGVCKHETECTQADASTDTEGDADADAPDLQENADVADVEQEPSPEAVEETGDPAVEDISVEEIILDMSDDAEDDAEAP